MSRKKRYIEKLTAEQKSSLEKVYKTSKCQLSRKRAQCIKRIGQFSRNRI